MHYGRNPSRLGALTEIMALTAMVGGFGGFPARPFAPSKPTTRAERHRRAAVEEEIMAAARAKRLRKEARRGKLTIKEAAIMQNGTMYTGHRHHNVIRLIVEQTGIKPVTGEQGFVTSTGEFVTRELAAKIALASGQIKKLKFSSTCLFSEDLY